MNSSLRPSSTITPDTVAPRAIDVLLPQEQLQLRLRLMESVFGGCEAVEELERGFRLTFAQGAKTESILQDFLGLMANHHPAFEIQTERNGKVRLSLEGPSGTKAYLQRAIQSNRIPWSAKWRARWASWKVRGWRRLTRSLRSLPDFVLIGGPRCGTTAMYSSLSQHPNIAPALLKEVHYFDLYLDRGLDWYRSNFPLVRTQQKWARSGQKLVTGEACPSYLYNPHVPRRIREVLPSAKLLVLLRNPARRAYSHYVWTQTVAEEPLTFRQAIDAEPQRLAGEYDKTLANEDYIGIPRAYYSYVEQGIYVDQLRRWTEVFPREQMLVLSSEQWFRNSEDTYRRIVKFLGLPDWAPEEFKREHSIPHAPIPEDARLLLQDYFRPHNERLFEFLGEDFGWNDVE